MKKLFLFDVDGTLVNTERNVLPTTILALKQAVEKGHEVGIITGRNFSQLDEILTSLPFINYVATINGGVIRDLKNDKQYTFAQPIKKEIVLKFLEIGQRIQREFQCSNNDVFYRFYFGKDPKLEVTDPNFFTSGSKAVHYDNWAMNQSNVLNGSYFHLAIKAEGDIIQREFEQLKALYGDSKDVNIVTASSCYIECDPYGIGKDGAMKFLQELSGVTNQNTFYFGDSGNDVKALQYAGNPVVMGNAKSVIKQYAKYIIGDHNTDAIHDFIMNVIRYE